MRGRKNYIGELKSSFLSCEKDAETILKKLFVDSQPYSDELKRLLIINNKDCLDNRTNQKYNEVISNYSLASLIEDGYIRLQPRILMKENEEIKSYILLSFDNFSPNYNNSYYRDCFIEIDVLCHIGQWDVGNFRQRPLKIIGYIDALLNDTELSGIGHINFMSCKEIILSEELAGYCLIYQAIHSDDDKIESDM